MVTFSQSSVAPTLLSLFALTFVYISYKATLDIQINLSPQGCRMSYMSPSYMLQKSFDEQWVRHGLAKRYTLWLYREVGWDPETRSDDTNRRGIPVLFIPGNAGSSRQVRSIASSATRQFFVRPGVVADEFIRDGIERVKPLDFYAVEFNEDLSAFHGPTLESQITYTSKAISYILSHYPPSTQIIVMGHSMGGIVATSLLPSTNISSVITMSTPHTLPPARFDSRIDAIYDRNKRILGGMGYKEDMMVPTPIVSLCGGATDMMIPSESCILPVVKGGGEGNASAYRKTVFSSALEGAWTGVGHREMVWCHQIRWRVARAALELGGSDVGSRTQVLDKWLRDGHILPPGVEGPGGAVDLTDPEKLEVLPINTQLALKAPEGDKMYLLPVPPQQTRLVLFVSQGSIPPVSPQRPSPLHVTVSLCVPGETPSSRRTCRELPPKTLRLIPNPLPGRLFPIPHEGTDESEGVVLYEADLPAIPEGRERWVGVKLEGTDGRGWVIGGFITERVVNVTGNLGMLMRDTTINLPIIQAMRTEVVFPNLFLNTLLVLRVTPRLINPRGNSICADSLLPPLIMHTSHPSETHYFPLSPINLPSHRILLHTHSPAPYIHTSPGRQTALSFVIYSSGANECGGEVTGFLIGVDWQATLGRVASRYSTTVACWAVGVVVLLMFRAWGVADKGIGPIPSVEESLSTFIRQALPTSLLASLAVATIPLPEDVYLGSHGKMILAPLAPLFLVVATGLVCMSWWLLLLIMWPISKMAKFLFESHRKELRVRRSTLISMGFIFLLICLLIPWQVAFLGCWIIHLFTCATSTPLDAVSSTPGGTAIPLLGGTGAEQSDNDADGINPAVGRLQPPPIPLRPVVDPRWTAQLVVINNHHHNMHLLLLLTWLLPLAAPVLAVWVRTLLTAGLTTPFDGDHFFLNAAPFLVLVDFASWTAGPLFVRQGFENKFSVRWLLVLVAVVAFFVGPRRVYVLFDAMKIAVGLIVMIRIGPRYWGWTSWIS